MTIVSKTNLPLIARLIGWQGLVITARRFLRVTNRWRKRTRDYGEHNEVLEIYWFRIIQSECFSEELSAL